MRIFALETDIQKLNQSFLIKNEKLLLFVRFHGFHFILQALRSLITAVIILLVAYAGGRFGIPGMYVTGISAAAFFIFVFPPLLRGYIDWRYDELVITSEKIVVVNQASLLWQEIKQMNLENIASVNAETQYWGLFPFGKLCFDLKEGTGTRFCLGYIPDAQRVCSIVSECIVQFQRRSAGPQQAHPGHSL